MTATIIKQKSPNMFGAAARRKLSSALDSTTISGPAGWILAGGRSSRMGTDKALMALSGEALALKAAATLGRVCKSVSLIGDPARYAPLGLNAVPDNFPGIGPLAGIDAALTATNADRNFILACDMPAVTSEFCAQLIAESGDCVVPMHDDGNREPLCAVYGKVCAPAVRALIEEGVRSVMRALDELAARGHAIRYVRVPDPAMFANLNTPEDVRLWSGGPVG